MAAPIVILSPHPDDAVLSCWDLLSGPGDVLVINVFAGMPPRGASPGHWDRFGDPRSVVSERIAEDRAALACAGREALNLGFLDRQYRSGRQVLEPVMGSLRAALPAGAVVFAPGALVPQRSSAPGGAQGRHPDHVAARDAALVLRSEGFEVALYADLPHASAGGWPGWVVDGEDPLRARRADALWRRALATTGVPPDELAADVSRLTPAAFARKVEAVRRYTSQVALIERAFGRRVNDRALLGYEVSWRLPAIAATR